MLRNIFSTFEFQWLLLYIQGSHPSDICLQQLHHSRMSHNLPSTFRCASSKVGYLVQQIQQRRSTSSLKQQILILSNRIRRRTLPNILTLTPTSTQCPNSRTNPTTIPHRHKFRMKPPNMSLQRLLRLKPYPLTLMKRAFQQMHSVDVLNQSKLMLELYEAEGAFVAVVGGQMGGEVCWGGE